MLTTPVTTKSPIMSHLPVPQPGKFLARYGHTCSQISAEEEDMGSSSVAGNRFLMSPSRLPTDEFI